MDFELSPSPQIPARCSHRFPLRYQRDAHIVFAREPIGRTKNVEMFKAHPIAFQGLDSPGPQAYAKPSIEVTSKYDSFPKMPFGVKTSLGKTPLCHSASRLRSVSITNVLK